jgi:hypothetical protein
MNHTAYKSIDWRTPLEKSTGETPDISGLLDYLFWDLIIYYDPPSEGEKMGRWLGRAQNYGDTLCHWIITQDTEELIFRGTVRALTDKEQELQKELKFDKKHISTFPLNLQIKNFPKKNFQSQIFQLQLILRNYWICLGT